jgi:hypothetical protein
MSKVWRATPYDAGRKEEWDRLVETSRAPHFLFFRDYMEYHADRFEDASLLLYEGKRLTAVLPANRDGDVLRSHGGLTFGGFVTDRRMTSHGMLAAFDAVVTECRDNGISRLIYAPVPHIYHRVPAEEDLYALFRLRARLSRRDLSSTIDLSHRLPPTKGRRSSTKRAVTGAIRVERSNGFTQFVELQSAVLDERYGTAPTHTGTELEALAQRFPGFIKLYVAMESSELLAGVVVYETETVAHTQYIAASRKGRERGAVDAIVVELLERVYRNKRYFDFGISTELDGTYLNPGLVRNKESYGARGVAYDRYELDLD